MKSIDINSANPNLSVDPSHRITIEFIGGNQANKMQSARCTVTVPYSSLSKRLQSIQRFGGKITNISIQGLQPNLPTVEPVIAFVEDNKAVEATPAIAIKQAVTTPLETHSELIVESTAQSVTEDPSELVSESVPEIKLEHVSEPILENIPTVILDDAPELNSENTSEAAVSTSKPEKVLSETTAKPKKSRASTKTGHGFSKKEPSTPRKEPVAIAEVVTEQEPVMEIISESISTNQSPVAEPVKAKKSRTSTKTKTKTSNSISKKNSSPQGQEPAIAEIVAAPEPVVEIVPEITVEPISETVVETAAKFSPEQDTNHLPETSSEQISDIILNGLKEAVKNDVEASLPVTTVEPAIESSEVATPLSKSKKTKTSSKSGNGFNKPKSDLQVPRSPRKPKN